MLLKTDEKILKIFRHHPFPFMMDLFFTLLVLSPLFLVATYAGTYINVNLLIILKLILILISILIITNKILVYWLDKLIITNQRVIHINWKTLINKEIHTTQLLKVQHTIVFDSGIIGFIPIFNYGTLEIPGDTTDDKIIFIQIPNPENAKRFIMSLLK
jgi:hypothetical protein